MDKKQIDILDEYLHDLGVIIHFKYTLGLKDMVILKPNWATKAFYKILDTSFILGNKGILLHNKLEHIWDTKIYPQNIHYMLLKMMNKFELAYELPDKSSHLVTELLPSTEPEFEWENTNNLLFYYNYDFLPPELITRFTVLVHQDLERKPDGTYLCWREGAMLHRENTRAFVKVKPLERLIEIKINGDNKRELLAIIRHEFDHINSSIKKIRITEEIPCICSEDFTNKFEYGKLLRAEKAGFIDVDCLEKSKRVPLSSLLDGYEKKEDRMKEKDEKTHYTVIFGDVSGQLAIGRDITQTQTLSASDKKELLDYLIQFQKEAAKIGIPEDDLSTVNGDLNAAIKEAKKEEPDTSRIKSRFESAIDTIKEAGDTIEKISKWEWTGKILKILGKLGLSIML